MARLSVRGSEVCDTHVQHQYASLIRLLFPSFVCGAWSILVFSRVPDIRLGSRALAWSVARRLACRWSLWPLAACLGSFT